MPPLPLLRHGSRRWPLARRAVLSLAVAAVLGGIAGVARSTDARAETADSDAAWGQLTAGRVVLMRHAEAPGVGDPPGFRLGDCRTQRNLDDTGRAQARRIGEAFRRHGVQVGAVLSSHWCRAHETAALAFPGQVQDDACFDSTFRGEAGAAATQTAAALERLSAWHGPGVLVVVTHQVNITALTGVVPDSGEAVIVQPTGVGLVEVGRLAP